MRTRLALIAVILLAASHGRADEVALPFDHARPDVGLWVGTITPPGAGPQFALVRIERDGDAASASLTLLTLGMLGTIADDVTMTDGTLAVTLVTPSGDLVLTGPIPDDGQSWSGEILGEPADGSFAFKRSVLPTMLPEPMAFAGELQVPGAGRLGMTLVIAEGPAGWVGHVDIPLQGVLAYPTRTLEIEGDRLLTTIAFGADVEIDATIDPARSRIDGTFRQAGIEIPLSMTRLETYDGGAAPSRPQHPKSPYPYREEAFSVARDGFVLAGTLTLPAEGTHGPGPYPLAVLLSGSGQQDRDETIFGHKPFLVIADALTRAGIAVGRYDDRGVGGSTVVDMKLVTEATTMDFAQDARAVLDHLRPHDAIDAKRSGLIGHSEGGLIALLVNEAMGGDELGFVVLMAGPGVIGQELLVKQTVLGWRAAGLPDDLIAQLEDPYAALLLDVTEGADESAVLDGLRGMAETQRAAGVATGSDEQIEAALALQAKILANPWMRWFLAYDPAPALAKLSCPVLAMNGTKDLQVWHEQNLDAIDRILREAGTPHRIERYEGLNHLFQPAATGAVAEYGVIDLTIDELVLEDLVEWLREVTGLD